MAQKPVSSGGGTARKQLKHKGVTRSTLRGWCRSLQAGACFTKSQTNQRQSWGWSRQPRIQRMELWMGEESRWCQPSQAGELIQCWSYLHP